MSATTNLYLQQIRASKGPVKAQQKQASVENTVPLSQQEMLKESTQLLRGGSRLAGRALEGLGSKLTHSGEQAFKNWGGDLMNMGSTRKGLGSMFGGWADKLKRMGQMPHNPGNALIPHGGVPRSVGTTLESGPTIPMGMRNPNTGLIPHRLPVIDGKFEVMPSSVPSGAPAGMPSALGLPAPAASRVRGRGPSPSSGPIEMGGSPSGMPSALGLPAPAASRVRGRGPSPSSGPIEMGMASGGPSKFSGGFGGMMDSIKGFAGRHPNAMLGAGMAGSALVGNQFGQSSGHNQGMNDAFNMYQQRSSGLGGNLRTLGNALGLVDDQSMFMDKGASYSKEASHHDKMAHFLGSVCQSNIATEEMFKEAMDKAAAKLLAKGLWNAGKSVVGGLAHSWGGVANKLGKGLISQGTQAAEAAGHMANASGRIAGDRRLGVGNFFNNIGNKALGWGGGMRDAADASINAGGAYAAGWGGSLARGTRGLGNFTKGFTMGPMGAGIAGFGALDGMINRKDWAEEGARRGAAQTLRGAQNMTMGQRLGFLFNPGYVAGQAAQQADGMLPGVLDEYNKLS